MTLDLVARSMTQELLRHGWSEPSPGVAAERVLYARGLSINVDRSLRDLASGRLSAERWAEASVACGIAEVLVALPASATAANTWAPPPSARPQESKRTLIALGGFIALLLVVAALLPSPENRNDRVAGQRGSDGQSGTPPDGKLETSGLVRMTYAPAADQTETSGPADSDNGAVGGEKVSVNRLTGQSVAYFGVQRLEWPSSLETKTRLAKWLRYENQKYSQFAGVQVTYRRSQFHGLPAYVWRYGTPAGSWRTAIWIVRDNEALDFFCESPAGDPEQMAFKNQCNAALSTAKIKWSASR
jgi:hypothetical protein